MKVGVTRARVRVCVRARVYMRVRTRVCVFIPYYRRGFSWLKQNKCNARD